MGRGGGDIFITDITDTYREGQKEGREGQDTGGLQVQHVRTPV